MLTAGDRRPLVSYSTCPQNKAPAEAGAQKIRADPRNPWPQLLLRRCRLGFRVLPAEALDASSSIHKLLLAGEERVTGGADFYVDIALMGRTGRKVVAARAHNPDFVIVWMNPLLWHDSIKPFPAILLF